MLELDFLEFRNLSVSLAALEKNKIARQIGRAISGEPEQVGKTLEEVVTPLIEMHYNGKNTHEQG